jgi:tripartite-type tricarboxylate transporter receptor subunit TctC
MPQIRSGELRALGQGGATRSPVIPAIPTIAETLPGYQAVTWYALYSPRATPPAIINQLNGAVVKILSEPAMARWLADQGLEPAPGTPAALAAYMRAESERFARIIKQAGIANTQQ